jgi:hypothetical protein
MRKFTVKREYVDDVLDNITVEGVTLPLGCKVVDYRVPNLNELFLGDDGTVVEEKEDLTCWPVPIIKDEVKEIYGKSFSELTAPEGWEFTGEFRAGTLGEWVLGSYGPELPGVTTPVQFGTQVIPEPWESVSPRLLLREKTPPRRVVFEVVRENDFARAGEYISHYDNLDCVQPIHSCSVEKGTVLRRVE